MNEVYFDPRNPDVMYASSWQRRRHQWTMIDGGPGSGIHKSTDGGNTWRAINRGLPSGDKGRIGFAISPINPDVLYAIVEASSGQGGTFRSENMGENWSRTSNYQSGAAMYYHELYADPHRFDRIYSLDTFVEMSDDGGNTWDRLPTQGVHVDFHAMASTRTTPSTSSPATTADSTRPTTSAAAGTTSRTCRSPSSTKSPPPTTSPSTTSTAAPRTTTPWAARRRRWAAAYPIRTGT